MHLSAIHVYPIKSCRGLSPDAWPVDRFGFQFDRRWMLIDERGVFLSQRTHRRLALVRITMGDEHLTVETEGKPAIQVSLYPPELHPVRVVVWRDVMDACCPEPEADRWFSEFLGEEVRLAHMPDRVKRPLNPFYARNGGQASFADAFPFLLIGQSSLDDLNRRMVTPLPMNRFRPNLVVSGAEPFAEDGWQHIQVGSLELEVVKPCERCVVTTTDQETAMFGKEPLRTLATFRRVGNQVIFGMNAVHSGVGRLAIGDPVFLA